MNNQQYSELIRGLPCVICDRMGLTQESRTEGHHAGDAQDRHDWNLVPLCVEHHRGASGVHGLHRKEFEMRYKLTDLEMIGITIATILRRIPWRAVN